MKLTLIDEGGFGEELSRLSSLRLEAVQKLQLNDMLTRARAPGGTPVDTGELRLSSGIDFATMSMGYHKEYAPHVEYGHRTRGGGWVPGQKFLLRNKTAQEPIYKEDVLREIRKGE